MGFVTHGNNNFKSKCAIFLPSIKFSCMHHGATTSEKVTYAQKNTWLIEVFLNQIRNQYQTNQDIVNM